jgi:5-methylcytosine-specific restriction enzyme subunit McrC
MPTSSPPITLTEYQPLLVNPGLLPEAAAHLLWRDYRHLIEIEPPSFKTGGCWRLTNLGWAGYLPLTPTLGLSLQPKVALRTLLRMVEVAYGLQAFRLLDGWFNAESVPELYELLALLLAQRVLSRCRQGLHRAYRTQEALLPYLRGQLQVDAVLRRPLRTELPCRFHDYTADVADNQILLWTLQQIARSTLCRERSAFTVRQAVRTLQGQVSAQPVTAWECRRRSYSRLNQDYAPLHALCAFFLEHSGPSHLLGDRPALPFVVEMARLYERFVAAWLQQNLDPQWRLQIQETHPITSDQRFAIDLVLYDAQSGAVRCVMDTKYKVAARVNTADVAQVVAYAEAKGATEALLIYPQPPATPLDATIGNIRVRTLAFSLDGDLHQNGQAFLHHLSRIATTDGSRGFGNPLGASVLMSA